MTKVLHFFSCCRLFRTGVCHAILSVFSDYLAEFRALSWTIPWGLGDVFVPLLACLVPGPGTWLLWSCRCPRGWTFSQGSKRSLWQWVIKVPRRLESEKTVSKKMSMGPKNGSMGPKMGPWAQKGFPGPKCPPGPGPGPKNGPKRVRMESEW